MRTVKAVAHIHSEWSYDARWDLSDLARSFRRRGCSVVLASEHDRGFSAERLAQYRDACAAASDDRVVIVPGVEYSDADNRTHVLVWGDLPFLGESLSTGELLQKVEALDGIAVLAHPWRKDAWRDFNPAWTSRLYGIELWNRKSDGWCPDARVTAILAGSALVPFASLDFHRSRQFFPLRMRLQLDGDLGEDAVLRSLRARRASARVAGMKAEVFASGAPLVAARAAERARKATLAAVRRLRYARGTPRA